MENPETTFALVSIFLFLYFDFYFYFSETARNLSPIIWLSEIIIVVAGYFVVKYSK